MMQSSPPGPQETELVESIELARAGDQRAFTHLFAYYNGPIVTYLAHLAGNDGAGRDLAQETFIRAWKGLPRLQEKINFRPWLYRIATNVARSYLQHERFIRWLPWVDYEKEATQQVVSVAGPEEQASEQECIKQVLAMLSPRHRTCLLLQDGAGFAQREIATILGISEKSVSAYVSRGRDQFRRAYQQLRGVPLQ